MALEAATLPVGVETPATRVAKPPLRQMEDGAKGFKVLQKRPRATWVATPAARERTKAARTGRTAKQTGRGAMCDGHLRDGCGVEPGRLAPWVMWLKRPEASLCLAALRFGAMGSSTCTRLMCDEAWIRPTPV